MRQRPIYLGVLAIMLSLLMAAPLMAQQKRKKAKRARGNVGLINLEKNYMILVTPKGKLITVEFDDKTKVTKLVPQKGKPKDIRLRRNASIRYVVKGDKNILKSIKVESRARKKKKKQ